ncbi:hypothetical protein AX16_002361 [Volvariella volvacea WC 439]|nr:hypothetical protein AX16_002361 [Volvariella volvacea WC 439]
MPPSRTNPKHSTSSSLLTGVVNLFAREFESFVTNATGGLREVEEEESSPPLFKTKRTQVVAPSSDLLNHQFPHQSDECVDAEPTGPTRHDYIATRRKRRKLSPQEHQEAEAAADDRLDDETDQSAPSSQSSVFPPSALRRRLSVTMPGSLYPRSPSTEPDSLEQLQCATRRHVRFASGIASHPTVHPSSLDEKFSTDQKDLEEHRSTTPIGSPPAKKRSPFATLSPRRNIAPVVKAVVDKFGDDNADPMLLLPNPNTSPVRVNVTSSRTAARNRGASGTPPVFGDDSSAVEDGYVQKFSEEGEFQMKGKECELRLIQEQYQRNERRWERDKDGEASQPQEEIEKERQGDKERIRILEEEIQRLKEELFKQNKQPAHISVQLKQSAPPPPPPPPPPSLSIHLPVQSSPSSLGSLFASARASLRHAPSPKEAPINPLPRSRHGQPTVGKGQDMTALLNELKTKQLRRKIGRIPGSNTALNSREVLTQSLPASFRSTTPSTLLSTSDGYSRTKEILPPSNAFGASVSIPAERPSYRHPDQGLRQDDLLHPGLKRKRTESYSGPHGNLHEMERRRGLESSLESMSASSTSTAPSSVVSTLSPPTREWQPPLTLKDLTTPSLCSDNSLERDDLHHEEPPSTPPPEASQEPIPDPTPPLNEPEIIDVDALMGGKDETHELVVARPMEPPPPVSPGLPKSGLSDMFARRLPTSPLPAPSPRKPPPPARAMRVPIHSQGRYSDEADDPHLLGVTVFDPPEKEEIQTLRPRPLHNQDNVSQSPLARRDMSTRLARDKLRIPQQRQPNQARQVPRSQPTYQSQRQLKRRPTLDEELRSSTWQEQLGSESGISAIENDFQLDNEVLTGSGMRSLDNGFMAHGGAGGPPVIFCTSQALKPRDDTAARTTIVNSYSDRGADKLLDGLTGTSSHDLPQPVDQSDEDEEYDPPPLVRRLRMSPTPKWRRPKA